MTTIDRTAWLPAIITMEQHDGDWPAFLNAIYAAFHSDFITSKPTFPGKRLALKRFPEHEGKEATFWHMISEGKDESERTPDLRRCERIAWPRPMIDELAAVLQGSDRVLCWLQPRPNVRRIVIAVPDFSYVVVLDDRGDFVLPWTAFHVQYAHQQDKFRREWTAAQARQKAGAAPWEDGPVTPATHGS
jgi:hypothetical protein